MTSWVLMYHRLCPRTPATECWFARGTAVTPEAFERQLEWVRERFEVVGLSELVLGPPEPRPRIAITFDDGYGETLRVALPICRRLDVRGACFVTSGPAFGGEPLWFDALYAAVGASAPGLGELVASWGFEPPRDVAAWVDGPVKRWLSGLSVRERSSRVQELVALAPTALPEDLYLRPADIAELVNSGWEIGGHGDTHSRLTTCDDVALDAELRASLTLLERVDCRGAPPCFAYPDGAWDARVARRVGEAGFAVACTVERGSFEAATSPLTVPRLLCRGEGQAPHRLLEDLQ